MIQIKHLVLFLSINIFALNSLSAQSIEERTINHPIEKEGKYALLVDNAKYLMGAIYTGIDFKKQSSQIQYEIVLIGPVVKELMANEELLNALEAAHASELRIVICEAAMKKHQLPHHDFHPSVYFTGNGFQYIWGLQDQGFKVLTL